MSNLSAWDRRRLRRIQIDPQTGCHNWTGSVSRIGYGLLHAKGQRLAHRFFWIEANGPIPDGLEIDHKCHNRRCVNLAHLELVTHRENVLRGNTFSRHNAAKTHCLRGHAFTKANTYTPPKNGGRTCKTCNMLAQLKFLADPANRAKAAKRARESRARAKALKAQSGQPIGPTITP